MNALLSDFQKLHKKLNAEIGSFGIDNKRRGRARGLIFDLIELENELDLISISQIRSQITQIKGNYSDFDLKFLGVTSQLQPSKSSKTLLTKKELEILQELPSGMTIKQISTKNYISEATVKSHLYSIYRKLEVSNRVQAIAKARALNILSI